MMIFYTSSTKHLAPLLPYGQGAYTHKQFSDGEWYLKLDANVQGQTVYVITATNPPADHLLELFLLLDALQRERTTINLIFTYFGYARQDIPIDGQASSAQLIGRLLGVFAIKKIWVIHAHSPLLHAYLQFENVIPVDLMAQTAQRYDAIAAPDQGAYDLIKFIAQKYQIEPIFLTKIRPEQELVKILEYDGVVKAKKILIIDDIIATGNTVIEVAKMLAKLGAQHVSVWATHGIFSANAIAEIEKSIIQKVYVTNTLPPPKSSKKIEIVSIAPVLNAIVRNGTD